MDDEERLSALLLKWEEAYEQGNDVSPQTLCADCPELGPILAQRIQSLKAVAWLKEPPSSAPTVLHSKEFRLPLTLAGRYRLDGRIAEGGFGEVWRAFDLELRRPVALKMPRPGRLTDSERIEGFLVEARKVAALKHPGIVPVHDVIRHDGMYVIVSDLIDGTDLGQQMRSHSPSVREAVRIVAEVASHLHYAHQQGVIHRDIKPSNILIDSNGNVFITDFGIAVTEAELKEGEVGVAGTQAYMSPEQQIGDSSRIDCRSDIYSLGVMLYELLTGAHPTHAKTANCRGQKQDFEIRGENASQRTIPLHLEAICLKSLSIHPADRYATAIEFAADLLAAMARLLIQDKWYSCTDPLEMFGQLHQCASLRKMRLFVCACIRHTYPDLKDERSRNALEVSERFADGHATQTDLWLARVRALRASEETLFPHQGSAAASSARPDIWPAVFKTSSHTERELQCNLVRELFGPLLFRSLAINPSIWSSGDGKIRELAATIYDKGMFDLMGVLADALESSGIGNEEIIAHCRSDTTHVKGCWALDLLLGKR